MVLRAGYLFVIAATFLSASSISCRGRTPPEKVANLVDVKLTDVGLFADAPIRINIGIPCPDSDVPDLAGAAQRDISQKVRSCDYVFLFKEVSGNKIRATTFLYRGAHPPATLRELCRLRYSGKELVPAGRATFDIDFALNNASKMPRMLSVEEVSKDDRHAFFTTSDSRIISALRENGIGFYDKTKASKRRWY